MCNINRLGFVDNTTYHSSCIQALPIQCKQWFYDCSLSHDGDC